MGDHIRKRLDWMPAFVVLGLLLALLGYGCVHVMVDQAERAVREEYERDITTLLMERLLPGEPVSVTVYDQELGNPVFTAEEDIKALTDLIGRIEWKWSGHMEAGPGDTPPAGVEMRIELDFGREKTEIALPGIAINSRVYEGFIEGESALNVLFTELHGING